MNDSISAADVRAESLAQRCAHPRRTRSGWQACCPAHEDTTPSLTLTPKDDKVLLHCHAGCTVEAIVAALGMEMQDLFVDVLSTPPPTRGRIVATYPYHDADGHLVFEVVRYEPKAFTQRSPDPARPGHWIWKRPATYLLYHLPEVRRAVAAGEKVYLCEGEKDSNHVRALGVTATCNPGGAGKWAPQYTAVLQGAHVVLLPDNDPAGRQHSAMVCQALAGVAASIQVVALPGLAEKGDVSDWLAAGGTRAQLEALAHETPQWTPATLPAARCWDHALTAAAFVAQQDVELEATVRDLVLPGCITVVSAPRASGKSLAALSLAVSMASGGVFRGERLRPQRVLFCDRDNPPALVRKRLRAFGAQTLTRLQVLTRDHTPPLTDKVAWATFPVDQFDVVMIDSLGAATEGVSEKEGKETQQFLATVKDLARRGPAILALDNTQKSGLSYRGRGEKADAVDILYECRNVTGWTPTAGGDWWESLPDSGEHAWQARASRRKGQAVVRLAFIPSKFRLGMEPDPFVVEIDTRPVHWTLQDVTEQLAQAGEQAAAEARHQERSKLQAAIDMLTRVLQERGADSPLLKAEGAVLLQSYGLSRKQARTLLESGGNGAIYPEGSWMLRPIPDHPSGKAIGIYLVERDTHGKRFEG